jgi:hypothetical protein
MPASSCFLPSFVEARFRNDFGMKEMMYAQIDGVLSLNRNCLLMSVNHYGYTNYGYLQTAAGYGRNFGDRFVLAARVFYLLEHARDYPARHSLTTDFAFACRISPKLWLEATAYNPFMLRYGIVGKEVIPLRFSVGCGYLPLPNLLVVLTTTKYLPGAWEVNGRFLTQPAKPLLLAVDCSNQRLSLLVSILYKRFLFSIQAAWHYRISFSPQIGCSYFPLKE